jgi:hypothetical protein
MPMERVDRDQALSKTEFHDRLREWLNSNEAMIGSEDVPGVTSWIYVRDGVAIFALHADTKRPAVEWYLEKVSLYGDDLLWAVTESARGNETAVVYGPDKMRNKGFYLYVAGKKSDGEA